MRLAILFTIVLSITASCKQEAADNILTESQGASVKIADNIIYDVIVKAESDDPWEIEKVAGYSGSVLVDNLFDGIYDKSLMARDYYTGEELSANDVRKIEMQPGFERDRICKIQFTEDWFFYPVTLKTEKRVKQIVFGYRTVSQDNTGVGYMAAFEIIIP